MLLMLMQEHATEENISLVSLVAEALAGWLPAWLAGSTKVSRSERSGASAAPNFPQQDIFITILFYEMTYLQIMYA